MKTAEVVKREGGVPSPMAGIHVPMCCKRTQEDGLVRVAEANVDGYAERWNVTVIDSRGKIATLDVKRCPACGAWLAGLESMKLPDVTP